MVKITGAIMAGGKSSRMGTDKGLMTLNGKRMVEYSIDKLKPLCDELLISTSNPDYSQFGLRLINDEIPGCGPIGGIFSTLKASKANTMIVLACDMPFVSTATIQLMIAEVSDYDCVVPEINGQIEPLCAVYSRSIVPLLEKKIESGEFALYRFISELNCKYITFDNFDEFKNCNTPDELV